MRRNFLRLPGNMKPVATSKKPCGGTKKKPIRPLVVRKPKMTILLRIPKKRGVVVTSLLVGLLVTASDVERLDIRLTSAKLINPNSTAASARSRATMLQVPSTAMRVRRPPGRAPETETETQDKVPETEVGTEVTRHVDAPQGPTAERGDLTAHTDLGGHRQPPLPPR